VVGIAGLRLHFERVLKVGVALRRRISLASDVDGICCLLFTFYYDEMRMDISSAVREGRRQNWKRVSAEGFVHFF